MVQRDRYDTYWGAKKIIILVRDIDGPAMPVGLEPFPRPRAVDKCILADYNMRSSFRPTDLVLLSSTIVRGSC